MTLDKFGRHLHGHHIDQYKLCLVEDISNLHYHTMFYILSTATDKEGRYRIINGQDFKYSYVLPSGTITHVKHTPADVRILVNGVVIDGKSLVGLLLNTGDTISASHNKNSKTVLACEFIVKVNLIPNANQ